MTESQTIRLEIKTARQSERSPLTIDLEVYPWHTAQFGEQPWSDWLDYVAREWLGRAGATAGIHRAVALDVANGLSELAAIDIELH
ncbi:hypothetical protein ACIQU4_15585 [Streptomyces sp. NPDC090741]|uniref:hypothetical protein n=1 Tax=Streptomyces sp. NPDC090741 TaxID=3365967 RepID=UPI003803FDB0